MPETDEKMMLAYLLGDLSEEEQALAATRLFTEPHYQQLQIVEEELIEDYVRGELSEDERDHFENFFLAAPHRRERVEFAQVMLEALAEREVEAEAEEHEPAQLASISWLQSLLFFLRSNISLPQASVAAVGLIALIGCAWLFSENRRLRDEAESLRVRLEAERASRRQQEQQLQQQIARNEQLTADLERERHRSIPLSPSSIFTFALNSLLVKGAEGSRIAIPPSAQRLRIHLEMERAESYRSYRVALQKAESQGLRQIASRHAIPTSSGRIVVARLPAKLFTTGDYILTLKGVTASGAFEDIADYQFTIVKK
jgi:hypothetical protein